MRVAFGDPAERLIALAQRETAQLMVVPGPDPTRGDPLPLDNLYLALAGVGPCPIVVVPPSAETPPGADAPIVCGIDGAQPSRATVRVAMELGRLLGCSVELVLTDMLLGRAISELATSAGRPLVLVPEAFRSSAFEPSFAVAIRRLPGGEAIVSVQGEIDVATSPRLEQATEIAVLTSRGRLVLDLSETTFIDVSGIRLTERVADQATKLGGELVLVAATPPVHRILDLIPHPWMSVTDDLQAALDTLRQPTRQAAGSGRST
jgi:anti-anti-sigma factor